MASRGKFKSCVWKFITWTPADLFYSNPVSRDSYAVFHGKILRSNLKLLFVNIVQIGVLLDILFLVYEVGSAPRGESFRSSTRRAYTIVFLSVLNVVYHVTFLLLRNTKYVNKYQSLVSAISLSILYILINQIQLTYYTQAPVQLLVSLGLLQMLVAVFYCQGSFVCSVIVWTTSAAWNSTGDTSPSSLGIQVIFLIPAVCKHSLAVYMYIITRHGDKCYIYIL